MVDDNKSIINKILISFRNIRLLQDHKYKQRIVAYIWYSYVFSLYQLNIFQRIYLIGITKAYNTNSHHNYLTITDTFTNL